MHNNVYSLPNANLDHSALVSNFSQGYVLSKFYYRFNQRHLIYKRFLYTGGTTASGNTFIRSFNKRN